ncbi:MAG: LPS export ABC transporter periplasmic protein LptC [Gammaproteobacteria bacterium]|nr:LPS export ABC transporter periplasmic protein LptC [Gammaproteobacteria bacterium]
MSGRLLLLVALLALIAALFEWRLLDREVTAPVTDAVRPGYYLKGIVMDEFGADGNPRLALQAATANEEPLSGAVTVREVIVDYQALEGQGWRLTSSEALVPRGAEAVEFAGDVRMSGRVGDQPGLGEMRTARLTLDTAGEHAETRDTVTLAFGRHLMHARGLQVDLKAGRLKLESEVHGLFTP